MKHLTKCCERLCFLSCVGVGLATTAIPQAHWTALRIGIQSAAAPVVTIAGWQQQQQEQHLGGGGAAAAAAGIPRASSASGHHCAAVGQEDHAFVAGVHEVGGGATFLEPIIGSECWESGDFENIHSARHKLTQPPFDGARSQKK